MTVRVERSFSLPVPPERIWSFIADPANRARAISVVSEFTVHDDDASCVTWEVELPIPFVNRTVTVETEDVTREPPTYVKFVGRSTALEVTGEHEIVETDDGARLDNRFVVDGRLPGVERFFKRNLDDELENLRRAAERAIEDEPATDGGGRTDGGAVDGDRSGGSASGDGIRSAGSGAGTDRGPADGDRA